MWLHEYNMGGQWYVLMGVHTGCPCHFSTFNCSAVVVSVVYSGGGGGVAAHLSTFVFRTSSFEYLK